MGVMGDQTHGNPCSMAKCSVDYFRRLADSKFTLSPAGDKPWRASAREIPGGRREAVHSTANAWKNTSHTTRRAHNNTHKAHANGIKKKKRSKYVSTKGMDPKFLRNQKFCKKQNEKRSPHHWDYIMDT